MRRKPSRIISIALTENISEVTVLRCGDRKDSVAWIRASIADAANGLYGRVLSRSGTRQTLFGMMSSETRPSLVSPPVSLPSFSSLTIATEMLVTSEPVPQVVGIAITSFSCTTGSRLKYSSCTEVGRLQPSSLQRSMIAPPPTAITRS